MYNIGYLKCIKYGETDEEGLSEHPRERSVSDG
jgi:hypothetical protein